jgi:hypothetical protein
MTYSETIDEKYGITVDQRGVRITRHGEDWLQDPPGAKAWISVADILEKQRLAKPTQLQEPTLGTVLPRVLVELDVTTLEKLEAEYEDAGVLNPSGAALAQLLQELAAKAEEHIATLPGRSGEWQAESHRYKLPSGDPIGRLHLTEVSG